MLQDPTSKLASLKESTDSHLFFFLYFSSFFFFRSYLSKLRQLKESTDSQLSAILKKIDRIAGH
jgi:hypothetical protein